MTFTAAETAACQRLVQMALEEDLGPGTPPDGDLTSRTFIPRDLQGKAHFVARAPGVLAGMPAVQLVLQTVNTPFLKFEAFVADGSRVEPGTRIGVVSGLMEFILTAERTALNFVQHLSGVATLTRRYVDAIEGLRCKILDTRKTIPGWRLLEKYAVRCGGGQNHRMGLYDGALVKDNHLAALGGGPNALVQVAHAWHRGQVLREPSVPLEIEVDDLDQLDAALGCAPDIILLDNMPPDQMREAVRRRNAHIEQRRQSARQMGERMIVRPRNILKSIEDFVARPILLEASGGVTLDTVRAIAETGVDRISVGALTHSAPALDIALDHVHA